MNTLRATTLIALRFKVFGKENFRNRAFHAQRLSSEPLKRSFTSPASIRLVGNLVRAWHMHACRKEEHSILLRRLMREKFRHEGACPVPTFDRKQPCISTGKRRRKRAVHRSAKLVPPTSYQRHFRSLGLGERMFLFLFPSCPACCLAHNSCPDQHQPTGSARRRNDKKRIPSKRNLPAISVRCKNTTCLPCVEAAPMLVQWWAEMVQKISVLQTYEIDES